MLDTKSGAALAAPALFGEPNNMLTPPKQITVQAIRAYTVGGKTVKVGAIATYDRALASELIANGKAVAHTAAPEAAPQPETGKSAKADKGDRHVK